MLRFFSLVCTLMVLWGGVAVAAEERGIALQKKAQPVKDGVVYDPARNHALIIGIDQYQSWPKLSSAVKDAKAIEAILREEFAYLPENIHTLYDAQADRDGILGTFRNLRRLTEEDSLLVYYAGHGWLDDPVGEGYWVPVEVEAEKAWKGISVSDLLNNYLRPLRVRHLTMLIDACFAGALLQTRGLEDSPFHAKKFARRSRMAMTSGNIETVPDEVASGHSLFNLKLQQFLKGDLPGSEKDYFTLTDIYAALGPEISRFSPTAQEPVMSRIDDPLDEMGEFVFYRRPEGPVVLPVDKAAVERESLRLAYAPGIKPRHEPPPVTIHSADDLRSHFPQREFLPQFAKTLPVGRIDLVDALFLPDGATVLVVGRNGFKLIDVTSGQERHAHQIRDKITVATLNPAGNRLALGTSGRNLYVFDLESQSEVLRYQARAKAATALAFGADGTLAAGFKRGGVEIVDVGQGIAKAFFEAHRKPVLSVAFATDRKTLISVGGDLLSKFWDIQRMTEKKSFKEPSRQLLAARVSSDGSLLALNSKNIKIDLLTNRRKDFRFLLIRNVESGNEVTRFDVPKDILDATFHANKRYVALSSKAKKIYFFDIATGKEVSVVPLKEAAKAMHFSTDGKHMLLVGRSAVTLFNL